MYINLARFARSLVKWELYGGFWNTVVLLSNVRNLWDIGPADLSPKLWAFYVHLSFWRGTKVSATTNWYWLEIPGECSLWSLKTIKGREMAEKVALSVVPTTPIRKDEVKSWGIFEQNVTVVALTQITAFLNFLNEDFLCWVKWGVGCVVSHRWPATMQICLCQLILPFCSDSHYFSTMVENHPKMSHFIFFVEPTYFRIKQGT